MFDGTSCKNTLPVKILYLQILYIDLSFYQIEVYNLIEPLVSKKGLITLLAQLASILRG